MLLCKRFPPLAASYQLKTGEDRPEVELTLAVGTCAPHWAEFCAVGVVGNGFTVTVTAGAGAKVQPVDVMVAVYVFVLLGAMLKGLPEPMVLVPSDQDTPLITGALLPVNTMLGRVVLVELELELIQACPEAGAEYKQDAELLSA